MRSVADAALPAAPGPDTLMAALPFAMLVHDQRGFVRAANARACASLGYARAELVGMHISELNCDFKPDQAQAQWARLEQQQTLTLRGHQRRKDGSIFPVETEFCLWRDGAELLCVCVVHDITRRLHFEKVLRLNEQLLRTVYQHAKIGIVVADQQGLVQRCNPAFCAALGFSELELQGLPLNGLMDPMDVPASQSLLAQLKGGQVSHFSLDSRYLHRNGQSVWVHKYVTLLPDDNGGPFKVLELAWDTTARRTAERALQQLQSASSPPGRVRVASRIAEALANELKQPFNALLVYAEAGVRLLPASTEPADRLRRCLEGVATQVQRAGQALRQLTDFLAPERLTLTAMSLNDAVIQALGQARALQASPNIRVETVLCESLPDVLGNPHQIGAVIGSLIEKQVRATDQDRQADRVLRVTVRLADAQDLAQCTIEDSAKCPPADEPDNRLEAVVSTPDAGPGLDLPLCRAIIESQGGSLWGGAQASGCSAWHFTLPLVR